MTKLCHEPEATNPETGEEDYCSLEVGHEGPHQLDLSTEKREGKSMKFRKKHTIEATQWFKLGDHPAVKPVPANHPSWNQPEQAARCGWLETLEGGTDGAQFVHPGDWIATGIQGEHWPIKSDIFEATYEKV